MRGSRLSLGLIAATLAGSTAVSAQGPEVGAALEFNHFMVAISVQDIEKETRWYVDNLNFTVEKDASLRDGAVHFRWLRNGNERIELLTVSGSQPGPARPAPPGHAAVRGISQVTLQTNDIEATKAALAAKGVTPALDITEVAPLGIRVLYLLDPEGNPVEIAEVVTGERG